VEVLAVDIVVLAGKINGDKAGTFFIGVIVRMLILNGDCLETLDDEAMMPTVDDVALWNVTMAL
jgi:hypothetical protein